MKGRTCLNQGQDDEMEITGYTRNTIRTGVIWFFIVITVGLLRLFFYWLPHLMIRAMYSECSLDLAQVVILKDEYGQWFVSNVMTIARDVTKVLGKGKSEGMVSHGSQALLADADQQQYSQNISRYFVTKKMKYIWNQESSMFSKVKGIEEDVTVNYFHDTSCLSFTDVSRRRMLYGFNSVDIHVTPIIKLLFKEVLSPFYIFQLFSCSLWYADEYEYYASCIVFISVLSITATIYQTRKMQRALRNTVQSSTIVSVIRNGNESMDISSEDLVPGDVIEIPRNGCLMQCDAVLITGSCIVNESMLTGESVPVTKTPIPNPRLTHEDSRMMFRPKDHGRHILFCGTHVIQTRFYGGHKVKAVVFRTGFSTAKGELVRSILYPKPVDFRFNRDTYKFVGILAGVAFVGFVYTIVLMVNRGDAAGDIALRALDLITIAVPPALPAALTVGIVFAQSRLKTARIYCISPRSINVCGGINTVCFDKTGTLTEDGLDMHSVVPVNDEKFEPGITHLNLLPRCKFMTGMATCHSLTIIDGVLSGDPLELIMFESIGWELKEPTMEEGSNFDMICPTIVYPKSSSLVQSADLTSGNVVNSEEVGIVRQFTFSSSLQRMSVIVRRLGAEHFEIFTKGAPEMIASLCVTDTVPDDFHDILMSYTRHGFRVLALAYKPLPEKLKYPKLQRIEREQVERGLTFLGLIVMENRLKPETTPVIRDLKDANIRPIMVTGDNMLTALSVARECFFAEENEKIILVQVFPAQYNANGDVMEQAHVEYVYTDPRTDKKANRMHKEKQFDMLPMELRDAELGTGKKYHFAVTGKSWSLLRESFPELIDKIVVRGTIFARMSPDQKAQLVECLQDLGYYVGMCGDGANDCGALKTAHAGISLSEAEASVASPFTSKTPNISCVPTTIREGRAALVTSFGIFKYMACYSLTQFVSVLLLYWVGVNLTDYEFLYIDLFLLTTLSITFGRTHAYHRLHKVPPLVRLTSLAPVLSLTLQMAIIIAVQVFFYFIIKREPWYIEYVDDPEEDYDYMSYENTAVYISSSYQYIILAIVFSKGKPYRKSMFTNYFFLVNLFICIGITAWINIYPTDPVAEFFELMLPSSIPYRLLFLGVAGINLLLCMLLEEYILDSHYVSVTLQSKLDKCIPGSKLKYETVEEDLQMASAWPPVKSEDLAGTFARMDSAFLSSKTSLNEQDNYSLSESETGSQNEYDQEKSPNASPNDIKLSGVSNTAFEQDETYNNGNTSTKL
ncbi:polyamine-transporting ATPase 13A3-like isoform X1 [Mya arenaria]|uniref:polyamine-transporting ATPase 13A3-like isoform X1 n=2 Tax=Mya arenaria TaxID=6604 RepID=UPI0022E59D1A|nr:polyamine-transporting ATPase 13A3-like isoform X1 [Mya arenaria]XP_052761010.1 polyamine-transporting ATPase 13A3-like isoform X1 [Mya arenaria]XP_052761011.1 polyamine-transporting ATPase 13A3-like isoform X1 [Mya arenaria]